MKIILAESIPDRLVESNPDVAESNPDMSAETNPDSYPEMLAESTQHVSCK